MLEVNLHPDRKRKRGGGFDAGELLGSLRSMVPSAGGGDPWSVALGIVALVVLGGGGVLWYLQGSRLDELDSRIQSMTQDSARLANLQGMVDSLETRRAAIQSRMAQVEDLDRGRYVWPHLLDELSRALPDAAWLTAIERTSAAPDLSVSVQGVAASPLVITQYVRGLRDQQHVADVEMGGSQRQQLQDGGYGHSFQLTVTYRRPPPATIRTRPLISSNVGGEGGI